MNMGKSVERLPLFKKIIFALGQFGWCLAGFAPGSLLVYFYMPPETDKVLFPQYIYQGSVFLGLTIIGLINGASRVFDSITDPIIANLSDRNKSKFGRRRLFLLIGSLPTALFSALIFFPPVNKLHIMNSIWLFACIFLYYLFITIYCVPYNALISELGHTPDERLTISTLLSLTWALGFIVGNTSFALQSFFISKGMEPVRALQTVVSLFSLVGFIFMIGPVVFIDEYRYSEFHVNEETAFRSLLTSLQNKNFRTFVISDLFYFFGQNFVGLVTPYFITVLLRFDQQYITIFIGIAFILSFLFYLPANILARKIGKKKAMIIGLFLQGLIFAYGSTLGLYKGVSPYIQVAIFIIVLAFPTALMSIMPNAVLADIAEAHGIETNHYKAAMFFGARTFMMKLGIALGNLLFPSFLLLGKSIENSKGIRISAIAAFVLLMISGLVFTRYNEKYILQVLKKKETF